MREAAAGVELMGSAALRLLRGLQTALSIWGSSRVRRGEALSRGFSEHFALRCELAWDET